MKTINETVGCTVFPKNAVTAEKTAGGFSYIGNYVNLVPLTVLVGNDRVGVGETVFVSARDYTQGWAKNVYKVPFGSGEQEVIFVPLASVVAVHK